MEQGAQRRGQRWHGFRAGERRVELTSKKFEFEAIRIKLWLVSRRAYGWGSDRAELGEPRLFWDFLFLEGIKLNCSEPNDCLARSAFFRPFQGHPRA